MAFFTFLAFWLYRSMERSDLAGRSDLVMPPRSLLRGILQSIRLNPVPSRLRRTGTGVKQIGCYLSLIWAGLIKYSSFLLLPFLNNPFRAAMAAWVGAAIFIAIREVNPWYILLPVAMSFASGHRVLTKIALASSVIVMYRYYPCVAIFSC